MSKNPFEVRLDIVAMAQKMLSDNMISKRNGHEAALRSDHLQWSDLDKHLNGIEASTYTSNDVVTEATALYAFVNSKK